MCSSILGIGCIPHGCYGDNMHFSAIFCLLLCFSTRQPHWVTNELAKVALPAVV